MRGFRLAAIAAVVGLGTTVSLAGSASAASIAVPTQFPATRIALQLTNRTTPITMPGTATLILGVINWDGTPRPNTPVDLAVLSGPNAGAKIGSVTTNKSGLAVASYPSGREPGTDVLQATFTDGLEIHKSNRPFVPWISGPPARAISSPATLSVNPTCFQPASEAALSSNVLRSVALSQKKVTPPAPELGTITVNGDNFNPFSAVLITFDAGPGGRPQSFQAQTDGFGHFSRDIQVTEPAEGDHLVRADDLRKREANTTYRVPCFQGNVAFDPPIGPPGFVSMLVGHGFPAGSTITYLNWIRPDLLSPLPKGPLTVRPDGTFQFPILILYHDKLGPRTLRALVTDNTAGHGSQTIEADAPFMVTLGRVQPPDFVARR